MDVVVDVEYKPDGESVRLNCPTVRTPLRFQSGEPTRSPQRELNCARVPSKPSGKPETFE